MLLYAPPKPNGGTAANIIRAHDRFTNFLTSGEVCGPASSDPGASTLPGEPNLHPGRLHASCRRPCLLVENQGVV